MRSSDFSSHMRSMQTPGIDRPLPSVVSQVDFSLDSGASSTIGGLGIGMPKKKQSPCYEKGE
jgi:hypothetical protein